MARNQKNFAYFKYVDDSGTAWNVRGESGGAFTGVDGHSTDYTAKAFGPETSRRHVRKVVAVDPVTFRSVTGIIYTAAAYAAIAADQTINVDVAGQATQVPYKVAQKIPEKLPIPRAPRPLLDTAA